MAAAKTMATRSIKATTLITVIVLTIVFTGSRSKYPAGEVAYAAPAQDKGEKTAEQVYKNIQVLKGIPASELDGAMAFMTASLGVSCNFCHTSQWDSDEMTAKVTARKMIQMTRNLNKDGFSGYQVVNCYTCHRGRPEPVSVPETGPGVWQSSGAEPPAPASSSTMPGAEQLVDKYLEVISGAGAIDKLKTEVSLGSVTFESRTGAPATSGALRVPLEVYQAAPNKLLVVMSYPWGRLSEGFNGATGWTSPDRGARETTGEELARQKRDADFFQYLKLKHTYPVMRALGKERVAGREAYVVGATGRDGSRVKLYFDAETGLLVREYLTRKTVLGSIPEVTDFEEYKDVGGLKLPFTIRCERPPFRLTRKFTEIKVNVPIDESKFEFPQPPPAVRLDKRRQTSSSCAVNFVLIGAAARAKPPLAVHAPTLLGMIRRSA